ncbi:MAG: AI-2E family transporter [Atopobiaceae bacterium]|nr:AI-2E family transporter [Atopobiaceae bacterium]
MKKPTPTDVLEYGGVVVFLLAILQSWDAIVGFISIVLSAIVPLVLGACIAYVVTIPTNFFERHLFPNSTSELVVSMRRPLSLVIAVFLLLTVLVLASSVFIPAFVETITMVQLRSDEFVEAILKQPVMKPFESAITDFLEGDLVTSLKSFDVMGVANQAMGGTFASIGAQVFNVVSTVMTGFFGILFSFILLTDTTDVWTRVMETVMSYLGPKKTERIALVLGVADISFHNFIVRQCLEAAILGTVGTMTLLLAQFDYALGVGVFMFLAALIPIVGYPVGLLAGAFMVAIANPWTALLYIVTVAAAQMLEATFVLPHVGDPRTVLPPVWTTVGVTIGGGVAGFVGMLVAIPTCATIRQLVLIDTKRRQAAAEVEADKKA